MCTAHLTSVPTCIILAGASEQAASRQDVGGKVCSQRKHIFENRWNHLFCLFPLARRSRRSADSRKKGKLNPKTRYARCSLWKTFVSHTPLLKALAWAGPEPVKTAALCDTYFAATFWTPPPWPIYVSQRDYGALLTTFQQFSALFSTFQHFLFFWDHF